MANSMKTFYGPIHQEPYTTQAQLSLSYPHIETYAFFLYVFFNTLV